MVCGSAGKPATQISGTLLNIRQYVLQKFFKPRGACAPVEIAAEKMPRVTAHLLCDRRAVGQGGDSLGESLRIAWCDNKTAMPVADGLCRGGVTRDARNYGAPGGRIAMHLRGHRDVTVSWQKRDKSYITGRLDVGQHFGGLKREKPQALQTVVPRKSLALGLHRPFPDKQK